MSLKEKHSKIKQRYGLLAICFLIIYLFSQFIIARILGPIGAAGLLKLQLVFSADGFREIISSWEQAGMLKAFYLHLIPDFLHPVWYAAFLYFILKFLFIKISNHTSIFMKILLFTGPAAAVLDLIENSLHLIMLQFRNLITPIGVFSASLAAAMKWTLAAFALLIALIAAVILLVKKIQNRPNVNEAA